MTITRIRTAGGILLAVVLGATGLLAACGDDDDATSTTTTATTGAEAPTDEGPDATGASDAAAGDTVEVRLVDYAFEGLPDSVPAGTRLTVVNESEAELHEVVAFRIPDDETRSVDELAELPQEELDAIFAGPPATVLLAPPGGEQIDALGDGTLSEPGRYALICAIPTGVDPQEYLQAGEESEEGPPEIPGAGPPHFMQGMVAELVVE